MTTPELKANPSLGWQSKLSLGLGIWLCWLSVQYGLRRHRLPELVAQLRRPGVGNQRLAAQRLGRIVGRTLQLGPYRARCLVSALVLYRLLWAQGERPELVIGLVQDPVDKEAHAWVEIDGFDVGPPPGQGQHVELARYG